MPKTRLTLRTYDILRRAVEEGVAYGYRRAHKYLDAPSEDVVREQIEQAVMNALCEVVDFEGTKPRSRGTAAG